jgi:hypothetical protein
MLNSREKLPFKDAQKPNPAERVAQYLLETREELDNFLDRDSWIRALEAQLENQNQGVAVFFIDVAGGGKLAQKGKLIDTINEFIIKINQFREKEILKSTGRRIIDPQRSEVGSDEFLLCLTADSQKEAQDLIETLVKALNGGYLENRVHFGAAFVPGGILVASPTVLRAADIALGKAKEANKQASQATVKGEQAISYPKLFTFSQEMTAFSQEGEELTREQLEIKAAQYPSEVVSNDPVAALKQGMAKRKSNHFTALSINEMKRINQERGQSGGDLCLVNFAQEILKIINHEQSSEPIQIYKIGTFFVIPFKIDENLKDKIQTTLGEKSITPYGFAFGEGEVDLSNISS